MQMIQKQPLPFQSHQNYFQLPEATPNKSQGVGWEDEEWEVFIFEPKPDTFKEGSCTFAFYIFPGSSMIYNVGNI